MVGVCSPSAQSVTDEAHKSARYDLEHPSIRSGKTIEA